jgi:acyl-coenzyme A synthetase/AMP-(fatty) acid ligase
MGFSVDTRLLITSSFAVASMYMRATACLRLGATCISDPRLSLARAIQAHKPTHVRLFQYQAALVLSELEPSAPKPERLTVMLGAGPLSEELRRQITARLATNLIYTYNTNETLMIAVIDARGIATPRPGAEVEVVDDDGNRLPPGQAGRIRVRTDSQVDGYLDDPEMTARLFKDGWIYTGDLGMAVGTGQFKVLGRIDEVLNIGGIKYLPSEIESEIARIAPVEEVGVASILGDGGSEELAVALVLNPGAAFGSVLDQLSKHWAPQMRAHVVAVDKLPRTETGKLQRHLIKSMFRKP